MLRRILLSLVLATAGVVLLAVDPARADILELLKTHKILLGDGCKLPCNLPPMNPQSEIRLVKDVIAHPSFFTKLGYVYPVNREEDIRDHPLMAGYFRRNPYKLQYLKTEAAFAGNTLTLRKKEASVANPSDPSQYNTEFRIDVSGTACTASGESSWKSKTSSHHFKYHYPCEIVTIATEVEASKARILRFNNISYSFGSRSSETFTLVGDRLYLILSSCTDFDKKLAVEFDWRGGPMKGAYECQYDWGAR